MPTAYVTDQDNNVIPVNLSYDAGGHSVSFTPIDPWPLGATLTIHLTTGITNIQGVHMVSDYTLSFSTAALMPAPEVASANISEGATNVPQNFQPSFTFNVDLDPASVN